LPNPPRSRQAAKRFRRRRKRLARRLLDEAYVEYLRGLTSRNTNNNNNNNNNSNNDNYNHSSISVPSPLPPSSSQLPSLNQLPPRSLIPSFDELDSPHSASTQRLFPDLPPPSIHFLLSCFLLSNLLSRRTTSPSFPHEFHDFKRGIHQGSSHPFSSSSSLLLL